VSAVGTSFPGTGESTLGAHDGITSSGGVDVLRVGGLFALVAAVLVIYLPTVESIVGQWQNDGYQHAYLIPPISLALLWRERGALARQAWTGSLAGLFILAMTVWIWLVAHKVAVVAIQQVALVLMALAIVLAVAGRPTLRVVWFPLAFLLFALPLGGDVVRQLMGVTADVVAAGLNLFGTPTHREGMVLSLPNGTFEVADACSGLNYLNAGLALGVLMGHLSFRSLAKQSLYAAGVAFTLILMNCVRALIVVAVANKTHMQLLAGDDHVVFGWVLFSGTLAGLLWIAHRYADRDGAGHGCHAA
jgi:exosortase A